MQRGMNHDTPQTYATGVANNDIMKSADFLFNNPLYDVEAARENPSNVEGIAAFRNLSAGRERRAKELIARARRDGATASTSRFGNLSHFPTVSQSEVGKEIMYFMDSEDLHSDYCQAMLNHDSADKWLSLSVNGPMEEWFQSIADLQGEEINQFNIACQHIQRQVFHIIEWLIINAEEERTTSMELRVYQWSRSRKFVEQCNRELPT